MIFQALACDYDGTLASQDRVGAPALAALGEARAAGMRLVLVTGRALFDLTRVCECLDLFDVVVAENGGVLYRPRAGMLRELAPAPPARLVAELDRRGILYEAGHVVVSVARSEEAAVREALSATGVSLDLVPNRSRLMLLPHGVSKGSGLRLAMRELGLSPHDVLALGDAENDLDLFAACGFSGCPADAEAVARALADWVFPGRNGDAVAAAIRGPVLGGGLRAEDSPRRRLEVGWAVDTAERVTVAARDVNVLIAGDPQTGKSWLAGALVERLAEGRYAVLILDPEGDYRALVRVSGLAWVEGRDPASVDGAAALLDRDPAACVVVDLGRLAHAEKLGLAETALARAAHLRRTRGRPHWVVLDEAHYLLHATGACAPPEILERRGILLVTCKPSWVRASVVAQMDVLLLARTTDPSELAFLGDLLRTCPDGSRVVAALPELPAGRFVLVRPSGSGRSGALTFTARPRETLHVRHRGKYAHARVPFAQRFLFRDAAGSVVAEADSLEGFRRAVAGVPEAVLARHAGAGDFSRWVRSVFSDEVLGRTLERLEARWRRGEVADLRRALGDSVARRYGGAP